jgi:hypothetical protein
MCRPGRLSGSRLTTGAVNAIAPVEIEGDVS